MIITSRSSMLALFLQLLMFSVGTIGFIHYGFTDGGYILLPALGAYLVVGNILKILINIFNSPEWLEIKGGQFAIKMRFRKSFSVNVSDVARLTEATWVKLLASYDTKLILRNPKLTLYLGKAEFEHLDEFLEELKRVNPHCRMMST